jgi:hypothetical protein
MDLALNHLRSQGAEVWDLYSSLVIPKLDKVELKHDHKNHPIG